MVVGVLALQGDFQEHIDMLDQLSVDAIEVRTIEDLSRCDAIILPGGESTVMMKLLTESGLDRELFHRIKSGMPVLATCAGTVLLSDSHLQLMEISVDRNAYGSQLQSFDTTIDLPNGAVQVSFIRAPKIERVGAEASVLCTHEGSPVLVQQGNMIAATFHTEVQEETALHSLFLEQVCALIK